MMDFLHLPKIKLFVCVCVIDAILFKISEATGKTIAIICTVTLHVCIYSEHSLNLFMKRKTVF